MKSSVLCKNLFERASRKNWVLIEEEMHVSLNDHRDDYQGFTLLS